MLNILGTDDRPGYCKYRQNNPIRFPYLLLDELLDRARKRRHVVADHQDQPTADQHKNRTHPKLTPAESWRIT